MSASRPTSPLLQPDGWVWAGGIEDTIIGRPLPGGSILDEYALTQHDRMWREDLDRAAALGLKGLRYGIPWHRVNPSPGEYDWSWSDEVLPYAAQKNGLLVIADLVHYGTPNWLVGAFADPDFPRALADYAGAFAERYSSLVNHYTPLNEPLVTASFCGERAVWPPYLEGGHGWLRIVLGVTAGIRAAVPAIQAADPAAVIVHIEAAKLLWDSPTVDPARLAVERERAFLPTDLLLGRVNEDHPLEPWLLAHGLSREDLRALAKEPVTFDVIGLNYYPELSVREIIEHDGRSIEVTVDAWDTGLTQLLETYWRRYGLPLFIGETSTEGDDTRRAAWLRDSVTAVARLREQGVPVRGYAWWPLFDFVDWSHAASGRTVEEFWLRREGLDSETTLAPALPPAAPGDPIDAFLRRMGVWRLETRGDDTLHRIETAVTHRLRTLTREGPPRAETSEATISATA